MFNRYLFAAVVIIIFLLLTGCGRVPSIPPTASTPLATSTPPACAEPVINPAVGAVVECDIEEREQQCFVLFSYNAALWEGMFLFNCDGSFVRPLWIQERGSSQRHYPDKDPSALPL